MGIPSRRVFRDLLRMAQRILNRIEVVRQSSLPSLPEYEWGRLQQFQRLCEIAARRSWRASADRVQRDMVRTGRTLMHHLESLTRSLESAPRPRAVVCLRDIIDDLTALQSEFDDFEIDLRQGTVAVTTGRIVLERVDLGRFRIIVRLEWLGGASPYDVVALDPHPAADADDTYHPHVQGDTLCEGEGKVGIRKASEQGRLFDLCVIVRQILETYHSGSAYRALSAWEGRECNDCGRCVAEEDLTYCGCCHDDLCLDCSESCCCHDSACASCRTRCNGCESTVCADCRSFCSECGGVSCSECLEDGLCDSCSQPEESPDEAPLEESAPGIPSEATAAEALAAILPRRLGQVPVPA